MQTSAASGRTKRTLEVEEGAGTARVVVCRLAQREVSQARCRTSDLSSAEPKGLAQLLDNGHEQRSVLKWTETLVVGPTTASFVLLLRKATVCRFRPVIGEFLAKHWRPRRGQSNDQTRRRSLATLEKEHCSCERVSRSKRLDLNQAKCRERHPPLVFRQSRRGR